MNTELLVVVAIFVSIGIGLAVVLDRASTRAPAAMVTLSLSVLTLLALFGVILVSDSENATVMTALIALAGTGIGALATSLTGILNPKAERDDKKEDEVPPPAPEIDTQ